ncbi:hypothetical protein PV416_16800 [Streptomyces ipomoeae]|uniref:hypothetical protein n=1 Tax=Streptomyces ipomoeae TaxID=103232 RepID=UPI0029B77E23|nr:hypothetical protein [Streptomyces ipomoeae]MDX2822718.1 hypothetical protein [Streptomyces ipomoeae]MDX2875404.1 hypothetical protein [Streptomyces ipomoeae]
MGHLEFPMDRRRFLTAAALTTGAAALPGAPAGRAFAAVPPQVTLPDRGIYDTTAASAWTDGFVTGNGEYGVILYGAPPAGEGHPQPPPAALRQHPGPGTVPEGPSP